MTRFAPIDPVRRLLARIVGRDRARDTTGSGRAADRELQSPEQRLLDVVARYGRIGAAEDAGSRHVSNAAAAGVRTVAPTEPSDAVAPAWIRRLAEPSSTDGEPAGIASGPAQPPVGPRRPRRR